MDISILKQFQNNHLLITAAQNGNVRDVKRLIQISDPKIYNSEALRWAARNGHTECVQLLIPVSEPKMYDSWALCWASIYSHPSCVDLLYDVSDPKAALQSIQSQYPCEPERWQYLENKILAIRQNVMLTKEVKEVDNVTNKKSLSIRKI